MVLWTDLAADKRRRQLDAIPRAWLISAPSGILDVTTIPESCGLLNDEEITITRSSVDILLSKLARGVWSSVQVTTAFYKRAVVAHQLAGRSVLSFALLTVITGELSD